MDVMTAIFERRAIRAFTADPVTRSRIESLIEASVQAPSARDLEPWAFVVFEGRDRLKRMAEEVREFLLASPAAQASPELRARFSDPGFDVFYGAPVLVVICATSGESQAAEDCCLAAQNFMLAARAAGLGTCPIGLARPWLSQPSTKEKLGIPAGQVPVFPLVLGRPDEQPGRRPRRPAAIVWR
ncbi:MAG TPA: nitroreductase [Thermoanaerobaculia bacterium]|nr:nitroreductase [Thermoanaerobaculia bacterium]